MNTLHFLPCDTDGTDYESSEGYLVFEGGSSSGSVQCATVPIVNDEVKEDNESFTFAISAGGDGDIVLGRTRTEVYIVDDDGMYSFNSNNRLLSCLQFRSAGVYFCWNW